MRSPFLGVLLGLIAQHALAQDEVAPPTRNVHYQKREHTGKDGTKLAWWLMTPDALEADVKYPLVLALHGRGGNTEAATVLGSDAMRKQRPCFVIAPAVSREGIWAVPGELGRLRGKPHLPVVLEVVEQIKSSHPIDPDRIYVTGQSMGGFGSFGAVATSPQTYAAAMPICGGWDAAAAVKMKDVALWVFHGDADSTVPVERSRQMVEALKQAGGTPKYTEYPGVGHNSWSKAYAAPETWEWLFAQKRVTK